MDFTMSNFCFMIFLTFFIFNLGTTVELLKSFEWLMDWNNFWYLVDSDIEVIVELSWCEGFRLILYFKKAFSFRFQFHYKRPLGHVFRLQIGNKPRTEIYSNRKQRKLVIKYSPNPLFFHSNEYSSSIQ